MTILRLSFAAWLFLTALAFPVLAQQPVEKQAKTLRVACSLVPVYVFTRNVAKGVPGVTVELLLPPSTGCPHHYSLTPQDVTRLNQADVLILNGLGLDGFLAERAAKLEHKPQVIEAGAGLQALPARLEKDKLDDDEEEHEQKPRASAPAWKESRPEPAHDDAHAANGKNPHVWTSIANAQAMTQTIAEGLAKADPAHAPAYRANAKAYFDRLETLKKEATGVSTRFQTRRVLPMHDVLDPLCAELGLTVVGLIQEHSGESPSAARLKQIIEKINAAKKDGPVVILSEPQYPDQACKLIARETGQPVVIVDPLASSAKADIPAEEYETVYRENLKRLTAALSPTPRP